MPEAATGINRQTERSWPGKDGKRDSTYRKKGADTGCNFTVSKYECKKRRIR